MCADCGCTDVSACMPERRMCSRTEVYILLLATVPCSAMRKNRRPVYMDANGSLASLPLYRPSQ